MTRTVRLLIFGALALAAAGWLAQRTISSAFLRPRAQYKLRIQNASASIERCELTAAARPALGADLQAVVNRTLGGDLQTVDHRLRTRLNRIREHLKLQDDATVGTTGGGRAKTSPARGEFRSAAQRGLREEPDFIELEGWISAVGTFEQAVRLVDAIAAEPWLKRLEQVKLDPRDNGSRVNVTVRLTTLFLPGRESSGDVQAGSAPVFTDGYSRHATLVVANPFRMPPPEVAVARPPHAASIAAPPSPYDPWWLTGVAVAPSGAEVWLLNQQTRESRRVLAGERFHDLTLVACSGDQATFSLGQQQFVVQVGERLRDRMPSKSVN